MKKIKIIICLLGTFLMVNWGYALNIEAGKIKFEECASCHSIDSSQAQLGPSLKGVVGRKAGTVEGYRYSNALKKSEIVWSPDKLNLFIENPQTAISGNRMPYSGMSNQEDRANLIQYLQSLN